MHTHSQVHTHTPICFLQVEKQALVYKSCTQWRWREQSTLSISGGQRHTSTPTYTHVSAGLSYTKHLLPGIWTLSSSPVSCASVSLNLYLKVSVCLCVFKWLKWKEKCKWHGSKAWVRGENLYPQARTCQRGERYLRNLFFVRDASRDQTITRHCARDTPDAQKGHHISNTSLSFHWILFITGAIQSSMWTGCTGLRLFPAEEGEIMSQR